MARTGFVSRLAGFSSDLGRFEAAMMGNLAVKAPLLPSAKLPIFAPRDISLSGDKPRASAIAALLAASSRRAVRPNLDLAPFARPP